MKNIENFRALIGKKLSCVETKRHGDLSLYPYVEVTLTFSTGEALTITADNMDLAVHGTDDLIEQWDE